MIDFPEIDEIICQLSINPMESTKENNPSFESGFIKIQLTQKLQIGEISVDENGFSTWSNIEEIYNHLSTETILKKLELLCSPEFTDYWVATAFSALEIHPRCIEVFKPNIVDQVVEMALKTRNEGFKNFRLMVDVEMISLITKNQERDDELEWVLEQSMEELNLNRNPASISSIEKLKIDHVDKCVICLDDFLVGSEVLSMPCSHIFHGECLLHWLEERNSCPICRRELPV